MLADCGAWVIGGIFKPNDGRRRFNLKPVKGGDQVFLQKQCWPLEMLGSDGQTSSSPADPGVPPPADPALLPAPVAAKTAEIDGDELFALVLKGIAA